VALRLDFDFFGFMTFFVACFDFVMFRDLLFIECCLMIFVFGSLEGLLKCFDDIELLLLCFFFLMNFHREMSLVSPLLLALYLLYRL